MKVLSVDLAYRDYRDVGIAILESTPTSIEVSFRLLQGSGRPTPSAVAEKILRLAEDINAPVILMDGPQGWKSPDTPFPHSRICERVLNTPAKTGLPGQVKPANYGPFVSFSIEVFDALHDMGWPRYSGDLTRAPQTTVESFPLSAWRSLRVPALPSKQKAGNEDLSSRLDLLKRIFPLVLHAEPNHDELQALVSGLAGIPLLAGDMTRLQIEGIAPFLLDGTMREGYIVNPKVPRG